MRRYEPWEWKDELKFWPIMLAVSISVIVIITAAPIWVLRVITWLCQ